jgi:ribosomal protein L31E
MNRSANAVKLLNKLLQLHLIKIEIEIEKSMNDYISFESELWNEHQIND